MEIGDSIAAFDPIDANQRQITGNGFRNKDRQAVQTANPLSPRADVGNPDLSDIAGTDDRPIVFFNYLFVPLRQLLHHRFLVKSLLF